MAISGQLHVPAALPP